MTSAECMGGPRAATPERCSAGYISRRTGNAYWGGAAMKSNNTPNQDTGCSTSVAPQRCNSGCSVPNTLTDFSEG
ncbi:hypothetical protein TNCV_1879831 [Trichonephila clavipes]|nr:hypothetical protein TNCV_1879831 [Trichonephila clavipes]